MQKDFNIYVDVYGIYNSDISFQVFCGIESTRSTRYRCEIERFLGEMPGMQKIDEAKYEYVDELDNNIEGIAIDYRLDSEMMEPISFLEEDGTRDRLEDKFSNFELLCAACANRRVRE